MLNSQDAGLVTRVYRLQRLFVDSPEKAKERTSKLCDFFPQADVFAIVDAEDQRRSELLAERARINKELAG